MEKMKMLRKLSLVVLLTVSGWVGTTQAALIGVCTFAGGCGPDFNIIGMSIDYSYNGGSNTGVLSINGTVGNASFLDGQLDSTWVNTTHSITGDPYGSTSLTVLGAPFSAAGNDNFSLSINVDGSGNVLGGNATMNGLVGVFDGGAQTALSSNGTLLDGNLITGGTISQIGWNNSALDFVGSINSSSLLTTAGFGTGLSGLLSLTPASISSSSGNIEWDENWSASGTLDVVVPVPAALWLFISGLIGLVTFSRKKTV